MPQKVGRSVRLLIRKEYVTMKIENVDNSAKRGLMPTLSLCESTKQ